uniref:Uncharacterized protein n=1 Tax=Panagrolaimus sp. JU765 TaxID=591449 RepID=A0AC34QQN3_9BILA
MKTFFRSDAGFFVDKIDKSTCYLGNLGGEIEIFLPHFFDNSEEWPLYSETKGIYNTEKACLDAEGVEKIRSQKRILDEDDYDEYGALVTYSAKKSKCQHDTKTMFLALVAAGIFAGLITLLLIGAMIVVCIAKSRMLALGKKLPGKPWETQATEDGNTFIDQTIGGTTMTQMDGVTSGYSTVA